MKPIFCDAEPRRAGKSPVAAELRVRCRHGVGAVSRPHLLCRDMETGRKAKRHFALSMRGAASELRHQRTDAHECEHISPHSPYHGGGIEVGRQEMQVGSQEWATAARVAGEPQWVKAETAA